MTRVLCSIVCRDLRLIAGRGSEAVAGVFFFAVTASLFALAFGGAPDLLQKAAPGIIWVTVLLSALLSIESVYHRDLDDGTLDLLFMTESPYAVTAAKVFSHWLLSGLPLVVAASVVASMLFVPSDMLCALLASLALGTLYASLLGVLGAALTAGSRRPGLLLGLLVLPLFVPMLLLGIAVSDAALAGLSVRPYLLLQLALVIAAAPLSVLGAGAFFNMHLKA